MSAISSVQVEELEGSIDGGEVARGVEKSYEYNLLLPSVFVSQLTSCLAPSDSTTSYDHCLGFHDSGLKVM